jgi:hypothetical protein
VRQQQGRLVKVGQLFGLFADLVQEQGNRNGTDGACYDKERIQKQGVEGDAPGVFRSE